MDGTAGIRTMPHAGELIGPASSLPPSPPPGVEDDAWSPVPGTAPAVPGAATASPHERLLRAVALLASTELQRIASSGAPITPEQLGRIGDLLEAVSLLSDASSSPTGPTGPVATDESMLGGGRRNF